MVSVNLMESVNSTGRSILWRATILWECQSYGDVNSTGSVNLARTVNLMANVNLKKEKENMGMPSFENTSKINNFKKASTRFLVAVLIIMMTVLAGCSGGSGGTSKTGDDKSTKQADLTGKTAKITIECKTAAEKKSTGELKDAVEAVIPSDGIILPETEVKLKNGDTVLSLLLRTCKDNKIHTSYQGETSIGTAYVDGIGNLFEKDCGKKSGWMYTVDGDLPMLGVDEFDIKGGENIVFMYTCNNGKDVGWSVDNK